MHRDKDVTFNVIMTESAVSRDFAHKGLVMRMHNPSNPSEVLKCLCLEPLGLTVARAAEALDVSRKTLSMVINGRFGISPEMAIRMKSKMLTSEARGSAWRSAAGDRLPLMDAS